MATSNEERLFSMLLEQAKVSISIASLARLACESLPVSRSAELDLAVREYHESIDQLMKEMKEFRDAND